MATFVEQFNIRNLKLNGNHIKEYRILLLQSLLVQMKMNTSKSKSYVEKYLIYICKMRQVNM